MYSSEKITAIDGVKIDYQDAWIHLRKSNTEPVIRIYSEALSTQKAEKIARDMIAAITELVEGSAL